MRTWAMVGTAPNPLADACDEVLRCPGEAQVVQELHLVSVHVMCEYLEEELPSVRGKVPESVGVMS
jgi:D-sedoheptulose 7-phosphate isomerase